ncbi:hypothetical protein K503DRAFT_800647 [Rhizopogon vinicolor AM-OR11-026]|uniref:Uncharacterized protein n=1 Tax=Rhizopogon vinicolor AM-OR11-026 TaxID=1314800 RepID=A0A1B7MZX7_9AGAM|nr:hypothetical protein K503DRAFT_800647 [Rhizopogon vinicolor AM-OR11-026]
MPRLLTLKGRTSLSKRESPFVSAGAKRQTLIPSLKLSSFSSSSSRCSEESAFCSTPVDSQTSNRSTTDISLIPSSPVLLVPPPVGTKIIDRFWPEEDSKHSDPAELSVSSGLVIPGVVNVLSPPPYHRRSPSAVVQQDNILPSNKYPPHDRDQDDLRPLRFPF